MYEETFHYDVHGIYAHDYGSLEWTKKKAQMFMSPSHLS